MTHRKATPDLGPDCSVRLRCRACRTSHVLRGPIELGRHVGDVVVSGHTFSVEDIEVIWHPSNRGDSRASVLPWSLAKGWPLPPR
jgi:hypothetical protein